MPVISRIWARSALISAGLQPQQETGTRATGQRNWPTHPAVPPGTDDQNSTPARELEPPQPLLRSLDGGQHPCAKIGANDPLSAARHAGTGRENRARTATHSLPYLYRWASPMRDDPLLDAPTDPDQLYQYRGRGEVPLHRPWNQGDIVEHLQVRGGLVLDLAMLVAHPCSLR